jgi:hypothetical protein
VAAGTLTVQTVGWSRNVYRTTSGTYPTGQWVSLIYTYDGGVRSGGMHIYINGAEGSYGTEQDNGSGPIAATGLWSLAGRYYDDTRNVDGKMAYVGYWNRVLSAAEIAALQTCEPGMIRSGLIFAPTLAGNTYNDRISAQAGTADGTTDAASPIIRTAGAARLWRGRHAA